MVQRSMGMGLESQLFICSQSSIKLCLISGYEKLENEFKDKITESAPRKI